MNSQAQRQAVEGLQAQISAGEPLALARAGNLLVHVVQAGDTWTWMLERSDIPCPPLAEGTAATAEHATAAASAELVRHARGARGMVFGPVDPCGLRVVLSEHPSCQWPNLRAVLGRFGAELVAHVDSRDALFEAVATRAPDVVFVCSGLCADTLASDVAEFAARSNCCVVVLCRDREHARLVRAAALPVHGVLRRDADELLVEDGVMSAWERFRVPA